MPISGFRDDAEVALRIDIAALLSDGFVIHGSSNEAYLTEQTIPPSYIIEAIDLGSGQPVAANAFGPSGGPGHEPVEATAEQGWRRTGSA
ncbi:unnamed protein product [Symbiodinium natans]|uniref:Uncharacterized protein n=1 Tax=Symbiodinium natans TaxID=878477 RepID=A0A812T8U8_9DINO|nr:unnamed protein product [Symbiodinium natans]